jgi:hypothetical protein
MKAAGFAALLVSLSLCTVNAQARDEAVYLSIQEATKVNEPKGRLDGSVKFYFGDQPYPEVEEALSQGEIVYKRGNISIGSAEAACNFAFLVALTNLQIRALREGANAVINIESYYKNVSFKSNDQFECWVGQVRTGLMLRGDFVRLKR